jgi:hypothetical protein
MKLLVDLGDAATEYQRQTLRNLTSTRIECDEIWAFCYAKAKNVPEQHTGEWGYGDVWTWSAIDPDSKLIPTWLVATRDESAAHAFIGDLGSRLANRVQITTDGHKPYIDAIEAEFGTEVDFAQLIKQYGTEPGQGAEVSQARNAFSKKVRNHAAAVALTMMAYNFARPHKSLANPYPRTPAMAAGVADHVWTCEEIAALLD